MSDSKQEATFAAGCFWGVEEAFRMIPGVLEVESGYSGGSVENPTYEQVCTGETGHAEAVHLLFDPAVVTYGELVEAFWAMHDPTTLNQQGPNIGNEYRSVIFYHSDEQRKIAEESKEALDESGKWDSRIVTEIIPAANFYRAEEYHQGFLAKHRWGSVRF